MSERLVNFGEPNGGQLSDDQIAQVYGGGSPDFSNVTSTVTGTDQMVNINSNPFAFPFFSLACRLPPAMGSFRQLSK
jgi:hypothetical protein